MEFEMGYDLQVKDSLLQLTLQPGKLCGPARKEFTQFNSGGNIGKVGIIGSNPFIKVLATFILKASNRNNIRFFNGEGEAIEWIKEV
jgi:hypothetical protein